MGRLLRSGAAAFTLMVVAGGAGCGGDGGGGGGTAASLIGVWCAPFVDPTFGPATVELILGTDGIQFQEQYVYQAGSVISIYGTYRVFTDPRNTATLRLETAGGAPVVDQAGNPIHYPAETYCYTLIDNNHMVRDLAYINCANGPQSCFVECHGCDPRVTACELMDQRRSCNAPG